MKGKKKSHHYKITFYDILHTNFDNSEILHKTAPIVLSMFSHCHTSQQQVLQ